MIGQMLGHYRIDAKLGEGGMGVVFRARDTKLQRDVALKLLPDHFVDDRDRLTRFQREAQVLASLNHPNIAQIYGLEDSTPQTCIVMELVDGETLQERLRRGAIPIDEALPIAKQIAEALETAHEKDIIHRDLKPANIKITNDGKVKVLDFGLAKIRESSSDPPNLSQSPTLMTAASGVILGTAAYMSPEHAKGREADRTADVWAFGCVLYEMLTGQPAFTGETVTDILARVITFDPDWTALPASIPREIRRILKRCLRKDRKQRFHDICDVRIEIEEAPNDPAHSETAVIPTRSIRSWSGWIAGLFVGGTLVAALFFAVPQSMRSPSADAISFPVSPPEKHAFSAAINTTVNVPQFALSPDGRALVFSAEVPGARPMLWVRSMEQVSARELAGTEDAQDPFWSPDSRWIGFFAAGRVKKIPAAGGPVQVVAEGTDFRGGTWGPDDTILFVSAGLILRVNAVGGETTPVTIINATPIVETYRTAYFLPDGHHFLYSIQAGMADRTGIYVGSLDGKTKKLLIHVAASAVYVPPGYVLFVDGDTLLAQRFDAERLEVVGQPVVAAEHVGRNSALTSAVAASPTGTIAYASAISQNGRLTWVDRGGNPLGLAVTAEGDYTDFRLSPDEKHLATSLVDPKTLSIEIWVADLVRNNISRFAFGGVISANALWSPDGGRLAFRAFRQGGLIEFYQRSAAGGGTDQPILRAEAYRTAQILSNNLIPTDWSPDGQGIIFSAPSPASGNDLWLLPLADDRKPAKFIASPAEEMHGNFSPDGHLVAYTSNESGKFEVYVETFPRSDRKWSVSTNGGYEPRWRADGGEIYYLSEDRKLMAVSVGAGPSFGVPKPLFQTRVSAGVTANRMHYVPSRDGKRFLVNTQTSEAPPNPITVVLNWADTVRKK